MDESTAKETPVSKADLLKSQRHQRRGAKGKLTRIGHALKSLIEERRPISEVQEIYERYLLAYEELQNRHESFSELIEDDDEYDMEERWMDECQQSFLSHQISFRDYCKGETEKNVSTQKLRRQMTNEQPSDDNSEASSDETASNVQQDESHTQSLQIRNVQKRVGSMFKMEKPKMPTFNGNVRDYCIFKADFQHALGEVFDERDALMILRSCLQGKPLQMIQGIGRDFKAAWEQLDMVYGDPRLVADAIIHDITKFRSLKPGEDDRFCEFVNIVRRSYNVLKEIGKENDMNNSHMLAIMEKKLTPEDRKIWFRNQELGEASATFEKFLQFLTLELKARMRSAAPVRGEVKTSINFVTKKSSPSTNNQERKFDRCWLCKDDSHWTDQCKSFLSKSFKERMELVKENKACFACLKRATNGHRMSTCKRRRRCNESVKGEQCKYYHHPLLHNSSDVREVSVACIGAKEALLPVVTVEVAEKKTWQKCNMLLDCGAQVSIIKQSLADELKLEGTEVTVVISKLGGVEEEVITNEYKVNVKELGGRNSLPVTVISLPHISATDNVPEEYLQSAAKQLKIDRKMINRHGGEIDLLVGSDHPKFHGGESKETHNFTARHSPVGWVILGTLPHKRMEPSKVLHVQLAKPVDLTEFWTTESMGVKDINCQCQPTGMTKADKEEYDMIERSCVKEGNQWQVSYPWKRDPNKLPDNRWLAEKMLEATERRLLKNPDHAKAYQEQMTQLVEMGFARKLSDNEVSGYSGPVHYISHHAVVRPEKKSTPVRIVFNSSASYQGHSLNEYWHKGPDMLNSLFGVLMKFRDHSIAISGDISKMYHRVKVPVIDQHVHRYLWRDLEVERKPDVYIKLVVTFGDKPSPAMAQIALRKTAEVAEKESPNAAQILKKSTYMDDICFSTPTEEEAIQLTDEIDKALADGGFHVKGWASNKNIRPSNQNEMDLLKKLSNEKVLGVVWNQHNDSFSYKSTSDGSSREEKSANNEGKWTKRKILSRIARIFDPLGFVSPFLVRAKMGMQRLWEKGYKWDERLPDEQQKWWTNFFNEMKDLSEDKLDRSFTPPGAIDNPILCVFSDASEAAFGCCAYLRWQIADGSFTTRFVAARSRVAPLKRLTIPRLELQAALMATRLYTAIKEETTLKLLETIFMTDSLITLAWIHSQSRMYKSFVSSRVGEIQNASNPENWRYVPGNMNPADKISRGLAVRDLSKEWEHGPEFLFKPIDDWPEDKSLPVQQGDDDKERRKVKQVLHATCSGVIGCEKYSSWRRLLRVTAYVHRFVKNMKARCKTKVDEGLTREDGPLTASELSVAELYWIKEVQKPLHERLRSGEFKALSPFLSEGIIRVGGRVDKIKRSYEARHPTLIPNGHHVAKLITRYYHQQGHAGVATTSAKIRTRYWIPGVQRLAKSEKYRCVTCREMEKRAETQFMSELPAERMMPFTPPFYATSCDYFGPIPVRIGRNKTAKYYGIIFTCLNTRSVHLEVAPDCSTMEFLQALRRFFAIRGQPSCLISDNGKQFVGAERELREMLEGWSADELKEFCAERGTDWRFVTPLAPHHNGCAEALVKSCKLALKKAIKDHCLFPFELYTYLQEVANLVNQRPIGRIPTDPDDDSYLCPNDILLGRASSHVPQGPFRDTKNPRHRVEFVQKIVDSFWKSWIRDVFPLLVPRKKWNVDRHNLRVDDIVIVADPNAVRGKWTLGRITQVYPGDDGKVRSVKVKTKDSEYKRPITKIVVIYPSEGYVEE